MIKSIFHKLALTLVGTFAMLAPATLALGDPAQGDGKAPVTSVPATTSYMVVNHIGEADQQISLEDSKLLAHRRATDPFGVAMSGKFRGIPLVAEHPTAAPSPSSQATKPMQVLTAPDEPTLEQAVQQLSIGAVNVADREALIGLRSVHEGDLLVLELSGRQFVVWVQSIDRRGVRFCDITLQRQTLKPFRFGPSELPGDSAGGQTAIRDFLRQDGH
jgi:hypothetical protein